jgi:hypothetical protein
MEDNKQPQLDELEPLETLEGSSVIVPDNAEGASATDSTVSVNTTNNTVVSPIKKVPASDWGFTNRIRGLIAKLNIYLLLFLLITIAGIIIFFVVYSASQNTEPAMIEPQELTQDALNALSGSDAKIGGSKQLLTVESDTVFTGQVLIKEGLDVAGSIKVGGLLTLPGITVSGVSTFGEILANSLSVAGDATVQGRFNIQSGLTVNGPVAFSGTLSVGTFVVESLLVSQNLSINRHINASGPTPGIVGGGANGAGGTVTISGSDTAGTITINVGSGAVAGVLATVNFANTFVGTPHVVITPVVPLGSPIIAGTQRFFLSNRTASSFSIVTSGALPTGSISFDYIVLN